MTRVASRYLSALLAAIGGAAIAGVGAASAAGPDTLDRARDSARCGQIFDRGAPLRCYETVASDESQHPDKMGAWRFVRTRHPQGGPDAVSIMHTADTSRSDLDLAGLMLRCGESGTEALVVLIKAFPLRARPHVTVGKPGNETRFEATVAPPGTALLLPVDATALVKAPWQSLTELFIQVDDDQSKIRGVVALAGLQPAFEMLLMNCRLQ